MGGVVLAGVLDTELRHHRLVGLGVHDAATVGRPPETAISRIQGVTKVICSISLNLVVAQL